MTPDIEQGNGLLPQATARDAWRYAGHLLRQRWPLVTITVLVLGAGTIGALVIPRAMGWTIDAAIKRDRAAITWPVEVILLVTVGQGALRMLGNALVAFVGEPALASLREDVVERALHLPAGEVERTGSGDLVARISGDVEVLATAISSTVPILATAILTIWVTAIGLAAIDWRFALAGLCAAPADIYVLRWYFRTSGPIFTAHRIAEGARAQQLLDSIDGAATVRAFRLGTAHLGRIADRSQAAMEKAYAAIRFRTRFYGRMHVAEIVGVGVILVVGFFLVRSDSVTIGAATAAALYFTRLFEPINMLMIMADNAQEAGAALTRLVGVASLPPPPGPSGEVALADASIDVAGARFAYEDDHEVLHGVDLTVEPGKWLAVIGASGAGKTTLVKLIAGVHATTAGTVRLGGQPVDSLSLHELRQAVVLLTQEFHVFAGPLVEDLRLARPGARLDEVESALERVGALGWVSNLPSGIDTVVGQGGHRLTATQAQELALARLLLVDAPIVILDEAAAEAGSAGARRLELAARRALEGRTVLVVAHRLTQAATADHVVVLDKGLVVERGRHDELLAAHGRYAVMWEAWSSGRTVPGI